MGRSLGLFCVSAEEVNVTKQNAPIRFTDEEMEIAKTTDLPDLLEHLGYNVKQVGQFYTTREMDSLRIKNRRTWRRYSSQQAGDAITFLQEFCGKGFREAVEYLLEFNGGRARDSPSLSEPRSPPQPEKRPEFVLPPANGDNRRVFAASSQSPLSFVSACGENCARSLAPPFPIGPASLGSDGSPFCKRGIAPQVIRAFLDSGLLYEDEKYHNCVFVGRNRENAPAFAAQRGTYDKDGVSYKRDVLGSDKSIAFSLPCDPGIPWVAVFEAPIDLMSFCTLHREVRSNAVALCGLSSGALDTYLRDNPNLRHVILCLDADGPGQEAVKCLTAEYEGRGLKVSARVPPKGKDWNEFLRQRGPPREQERC